MTPDQQAEYDYILAERMGLGSTAFEANRAAMAWVMAIEWDTLPAASKSPATSKNPAAPL